MKMKAHRYVLMLSVIALLAGAPAAEMEAQLNEFNVTYFDGCEAFTYVGNSHSDCNGSSSSSGTENARWKQVERIKCSTGATFIHYYEYFYQSGWNSVTEENFGVCSESVLIEYYDCLGFIRGWQAKDCGGSWTSSGNQSTVYRRETRYDCYTLQYTTQWYECGAPIIQPSFTGCPC